MDKIETDILIIGGGLIGASLALTLRETPWQVTVVDAHPLATEIQSNFDARSLALSMASVRILQGIGLWEQVLSYACPIKKIHVSEQARFGRLCLGGQGETLGHVVEMQYLSHALAQQLPNPPFLCGKVTAIDPELNSATVLSDTRELQIKARLIVAADGTESSVRTLCGIKATQKDYPQTALIANIGLTRSHQHIAYERFTPSGPLAMLPMNDDRAALVWSVSPGEAGRLQTLDEAAFLSALQRAFGYRLGRFASVGRRICYPLRQVMNEKQYVKSIVFIGNAAHTLHPAAGQGFNLGLRDVAMLAQCIHQRGLSPLMLNDYATARLGDQQNIAQLTDGLVRLFTCRLPFIGLVRQLGLVAMEHFSPFKSVLMRYAGGFGGVLPDLVCQIPLTGDARG